MTESAAKTYLANAKNDRRGSIAIITALMLVPIVFLVGVAVDMGRLVAAETALQEAADGAALAGAAAYQNSTLTANAVSVATLYFTKATQAPGVTVPVGATTVTAKIGQNTSGVSSFNVYVTSSGTIRTTFLAIGGITTLTFGTKSAAANPAVRPVITLGPLGSTASDWNFAFMYVVPSDANGKPQYATLPPISAYYEIGSNCNAIDYNWSTTSRCYGQQYSVASQNQSGFPAVAATAPLAFLFANMNVGELTAPADKGGNAYGAQAGNYELLMSAQLSLGNTPSYATDTSAQQIYQLTGANLSQAPTHYSSLGNQNCALQIVQVDPNNLPTLPPYPGICLAPTDPRSGSQYANLSCAQIAGRTFMYWWNDMGGHTDDFDYHNLYYTLRCVPGTGSPDGGVISNNSVPPGASTNISLIAAP